MLKQDEVLGKDGQYSFQRQKYFFPLWQETNFKTELQIFSGQNQYYLSETEPTCRSA